VPYDFSDFLPLYCDWWYQAVFVMTLERMVHHHPVGSVHHILLFGTCVMGVAYYWQSSSSRDDDDWGEGDSCRGDHNDHYYCIQPTKTDDTTAIMNVAPYRLVDVVVLRMMMMLMKIHKA
jgi:hypothetical protein